MSLFPFTIGTVRSAIYCISVEGKFGTLLAFVDCSESKLSVCESGKAGWKQSRWAEVIVDTEEGGLPVRWWSFSSRNWWFASLSAEPCSTGEHLSEKAEHSQCFWTAVTVFVTVGIEVDGDERTKPIFIVQSWQISCHMQVLYGMGSSLKNKQTNHNPSLQTDIKQKALTTNQTTSPAQTFNVIGPQAPIYGHERITRCFLLAMLMLKTV